jgi:hypothetical protein
MPAGTTRSTASSPRCGGAGLTNDKACALGKFARVALRKPSIDYSGRFLHVVGGGPRRQVLEVIDWATTAPPTRRAA